MSQVVTSQPSGLCLSGYLILKMNCWCSERLKDIISKFEHGLNFLNQPKAIHFLGRAVWDLEDCQKGQGLIATKGLGRAGKGRTCRTGVAWACCLAIVSLYYRQEYFLFKMASWLLFGNYSQVGNMQTELMEIKDGFGAGWWRMVGGETVCKGPFWWREQAVNCWRAWAFPKSVYLAQSCDNCYA